MKEREEGAKPVVLTRVDTKLTIICELLRFNPFTANFRIDSGQGVVVLSSLLPVSFGRHQMAFHVAYSFLRPITSSGHNLSCLQ